MLPRVYATGNLTRDPELRFTPSGKAVSTVSLACNDRRKVGDKWEDGDPCFLDVTVWGDDAEALSTLTKGQRITVEGRLGQRSYETRDGDKRTVYEVTASLVTLPLTTPPSRSSAAPPSSPAVDPWTTGTAATPTAAPF